MRNWNIAGPPLISGGLVGLIALFSGTTSQIIILSVLGAMVMYVVSLLSLFRLRQTEPDMPRPFAVPGFPVVPGLALGLALLCLGAIVLYNQTLSLIFVGLLAGSWGIFKLFSPSEKNIKPLSKAENS